MIKICPACSGMNADELRNALLGVEIEEECIGECGCEFTGCVNDELVTASSQEDFIAQAK